MNVKQISFQAKPENYAVIDKYLSRSAQPKKDDLIWLKNHGVTDIINLRTMRDPKYPIFDEGSLVKSCGMNYHHIPSSSKAPDEKSVLKFLEVVDDLSSKNAKIHVHCWHGADRTGLYSFVYKSLKNIGSTTENINEWIARGLNLKKYPNLIEWGLDFVNKYKNRIIKS